VGLNGGRNMVVLRACDTSRGEITPECFEPTLSSDCGRCSMCCGPTMAIGWRVYLSAEKGFNINFRKGQDLASYLLGSSFRCLIMSSMKCEWAPFVVRCLPTVVMLQGFTVLKMCQLKETFWNGWCAIY
jgi:hypothetical protein